MKSRLNLKPGQKGTKKLVEQCGRSLLYVRYRYDEHRGVRLKTVELVVEEKPWNPKMPLRDGDMVPVRIAYGEIDLRDQLKAVGGEMGAGREALVRFIRRDSRHCFGGKDSGRVQEGEAEGLAS